MYKTKIFLLAFCMSLTLSFANLDANNPHELLAVNKNWYTYSTQYDSNSNPVCFIVSHPVSEKGNFQKRDKPYLMVLQVAENKYEVSVSPGYAYSKDKISVKIDNKDRSMFTKGEIAWTESDAMDQQFISEMKAGSNFVVFANSKKGSNSIDKYSLFGFTKAFENMITKCALN